MSQLGRPGLGKELPRIGRCTPGGTWLVLWCQMTCRRSRQDRVCIESNQFSCCIDHVGKELGIEAAPHGRESPLGRCRRSHPCNSDLLGKAYSHIGQEDLDSKLTCSLLY